MNSSPQCCARSWRRGSEAIVAVQCYTHSLSWAQRRANADRTWMETKEAGFACSHLIKRCPRFLWCNHYVVIHCLWIYCLANKCYGVRQLFDFFTLLCVSFLPVIGTFSIRMQASYLGFTYSESTDLSVLYLRPTRKNCEFNKKCYASCLLQ